MKATSTQDEAIAGRGNPDEKAIIVHIGNRIKLRRTILGISQDGLGKLLGITFQQVQKYERGANRISAGRLYVLAQKLGTDVGYFYDGLAYPGRRQDDNPLATRGNLEAMRSLQQLSKPVRHAIVNLLHCVSNQEAQN